MTMTSYSPPANVGNQDRFGLAALGAVGAAAALLNLGIVRELAQAAGYGEAASWLYWLVLDFFAVIAMRGGFRATTPKVRSWAAFSSVLALALSGVGAGLHVFIEAAALPREIAFGVLCLPAVMLGLSLHLVLLMRLESRGLDEQGSGHDERMQASIEVTERVTERTAERRSITRRGGGKQARFLAALDELPAGDSRKAGEIVEALNDGIDLHPATARRLVAAHRRGAMA